MPEVVPEEIGTLEDEDREVLGVVMVLLSVTPIELDVAF